MSALCGGAQGLVQDTLAQYLFTLLMASTAALWTVLDARRHNRPIVHIGQLVVFFFWPIAVPLYLIWTRGFRGLGWAVLHAVGLFLTLYIAYVATGISAYGVDAFVPQS